MADPIGFILRRLAFALADWRYSLEQKVKRMRSAIDKAVEERERICAKRSDR